MILATHLELLPKCSPAQWLRPHLGTCQTCKPQSPSQTDQGRCGPASGGPTCSMGAVMRPVGGEPLRQRKETVWVGPGMVDQ